MQTLFELAGGIGLALLTIWGIRSVSRIDERRSYAVIIVVCALVYVGFAWADSTVGAMFTESCGLLIFGGVAWAGWRVHPGWLLAGLLGHALWDVGHEWAVLSTNTPSWYVYFCLYYDLTVAVFCGFVGTREGELTPLSLTDISAGWGKFIGT